MIMATRKQQIVKFQAKVEELQQELEVLIDDMQDALDSLPENLQQSTTAETMQDRLDILAGWNDELENIATGEVE